MQSCRSRVGKSSLKSARDTGYLRCAQRRNAVPVGWRAFGFNIPGIVTAYIETYQPKSRRGEGERIPIDAASTRQSGNVVVLRTDGAGGCTR